MDTERRLNKLKKALEPYSNLMDKASDELINQEITKYPIFISHKEELNLGIPLIDRNTSKSLYSINISTLEELATKNVIKEDRVQNFIEIFKSPEDYYCLFVLDQLGAKFVFIPRE